MLREIGDSCRNWAVSILLVLRAGYLKESRRSFKTNTIWRGLVDRNKVKGIGLKASAPIHYGCTIAHVLGHLRAEPDAMPKYWLLPQIDVP